MWTREEGDEDTKETMGQRGAAKRADSNDTRVPQATEAQARSGEKACEKAWKIQEIGWHHQISRHKSHGLDSNRDEGKLRKKTDLGGGGKTANFLQAVRTW